MAKVEFEGGGMKVISGVNADHTPVDDTVTLCKRPDGQPANVPTKYLGYYKRKGFVEADAFDFDDYIPAQSSIPKMSKAEMKKIIEEAVERKRTDLAQAAMTRRREELELQDIEEKKILKEVEKIRKLTMESRETQGILAQIEVEAKARLLAGTRKITAPDPGASMEDGTVSTMEM